MNGAPANPINGTVAQLGDQRPRGRGDVRDVGGDELAQHVQVGRRADRLLDDRADAGDDVDPDPDGHQRHHDVGEEDGGVDAVPAHRLQRDLGDELRVAARIEHRVAGAQCPVFGQRAPGLAHEPHWRTGARAAGRGTDEKGL